jgi:hypothetical protein
MFLPRRGHKNAQSGNKNISREHEAKIEVSEKEKCRTYNCSYII